MLVDGALGLGLQPPVPHELVAAIHPEHRVGVAYVDCQKHCRARRSCRPAVSYRNAAEAVNERSSERRNLDADASFVAGTIRRTRKSAHPAWMSPGRENGTPIAQYKLGEDR